MYLKIHKIFLTIRRILDFFSPTFTCVNQRIFQNPFETERVVSDIFDLFDVMCALLSSVCNSANYEWVFMNYWWYLLTVSRKRNQNEFAWKNTKKLTTHLIITLMCFLFIQANLIVVPFPTHRQQVPSFYKSCTQTFMKCTQSTAANKPSLKWNMSVVRSWLVHIEYCSSLLIHASFQSNSLSFTASECFISR